MAEKRMPYLPASSSAVGVGRRVKKGGKAALVWSGLLEEQMGRPGVLRAAAKRFTLRKPASGTHVTARPRNNRPAIAREITTVNPDERNRLLEVHKNAVLKSLAKRKARKRKKA